MSAGQKLFDVEEIDGDCPELSCICGAILDWKDCGNGCDEGYFDMYEEDPSWYDYGDFEECEECHGRGVYWVCPNVSRHGEAGVTP